MRACCSAAMPMPVSSTLKCRQMAPSSTDSRWTRRLEHLHLSCSVLGAKKEPLAVGGRDGLEGGFGGQKQLLVGTGSVAAQDLFDLAPHGLDRIEIRRIRRQIEQSGAGGFDD